MGKQEEISLWIKLKDGITQTFNGVKRSFVKNMDAIKQSALVFAGVFAGMVAGMWKAVDAFKEQERVEAEMETRLKSTGYAAGMTGEELKKLAGELQKTTGVSDEVTMSAQNMLLTFTNIGKESFPGATSAVLDMTAAMNKGKITQEGLKASAIMLGKGLNDPIGQLGALSRVGIAFTEQQKNQIKEMARTGDMAGAQAIILGELNREFGGTAGNLNTLEGAQRASQAAFGDMLEVIGEAFLPVMTSLAILVKNASEKLKEFLPKIKDLIVPIFAGVSAFTGLIAAIGGVVTIAPTLTAALAAILGPIGLIALGISGAISGFLYFKNSSSETAIKVRAIFESLGAVFANFGELVKNALTLNISGIKSSLSAIREEFQKNYDTEKDEIADLEKIRIAEEEAKRERAAQALEGKAEDKEAEIEIDQDFLDRKAEMEQIAEDARITFEEQKKQYDQMSAADRIQLLVDTLGKEKILQTTAQIDELIAQGKHNEAKKKQDELYRDAFNKLNEDLIKETHDKWRDHWDAQIAMAVFGREMSKREYEALGQAFADVMTLMGEESIAAFRVMQGVAITETIIKTYEAAQKAYAALAGIPIVGPVLGGVAAGVAVAAGLARVENIRRQRPPQAETGAYVKSGGYAELHDQEMVLNKKQTEALAQGGGAQHIYLQMNGETLQKWIVETDREGERMQRMGIR